MWFKVTQGCHFRYQSITRIFDFLIVNNTDFTSYLVSHTVFKMSRIIGLGQIFAVDRGVPLFNAVVLGEPLIAIFGLKKLAALSYGMVPSLFRYLEACDRWTDKHTRRKCRERRAAKTPVAHAGLTKQTKLNYC